MTISLCLVPESDLETWQKPGSSRLGGQVGSCLTSYSTECCNVSDDHVWVPDETGSRKLQTHDSGLNLR